MKKRKIAAMLAATIVCTNSAYVMGLPDSYAAEKTPETAYRLATSSQAEKEDLPGSEKETESVVRKEQVSGEESALAEQATGVGIPEREDQLDSATLDIYVRTIDDEDEENTYYLSECWADTVCLVVFGSSNCGITVPTLKELNEVAEDYKEKPVNFLFIDLYDDADKVRDCAASIPNIQVCNDKVSNMGVTYNRCWNFYLDEAGNDANPSRFPHVFMVKDGQVVYQNVQGRVITRNTFAQELDRILDTGDEEKPEEPIPVDFEARKQEIVDFYQANPFHLNHTVTYDQEPVLKENGYEAGVLSEDTLKDGLNALNFVRFVAGLSSDVEINEQYQDYVQKGAVLMHSQNKEEHFIKPCPAGMAEDFYNDAYRGTSNANIAYGNVMLSPSYNVINQWMYDGDRDNIAMVGHRRWCLNPDMGSTGYGYSGGYSAMYIQDHSGTPGTEQGYTAWPAQVMPFEYFKGPWTVSLDRRELAFDSNDVVVTLKYEGKTFLFSSTDKSNGYFRVSLEETDGQIGSGPTVIFRPNFSLHSDSVVEVTIEGVRDLDGREKTIRYTVRFFSMEDEIGDNSSDGNGGQDDDREDGSGSGNDSSGSTSGEGDGSSGGDQTGDGNGSSGSTSGEGDGSSGGDQTGDGNDSSGSTSGEGDGSSGGDQNENETGDGNDSSGSTPGVGDGSSGGDQTGDGNDSSGSTSGEGDGSSGGDQTGDGNGSGSSSSDGNDDSKGEGGSGSGSNSGNGSDGSSSGSGGRRSSGGGRRSLASSFLSSSSLPSYVAKGSWTKGADGLWRFVDESGQPYVNRWGAIFHSQAATTAGAMNFDWYRFDENGAMLTGWYTDPVDGRIYYLNPASDGAMGRMMTGWITIDGKEYYFNTQSDGLLGRMYQNEETPDGHFVDASGVKVQ